MSRLEACGGVSWCAKQLCLAVTRGCHVADLDCSNCGLPHLTDVTTCTPQRKHVCGGCNHAFVVDGECVVSNPLVAFVREHNGDNLEGNQFCGLDTFSCADVLACVASLGVDLSMEEVSTFIADHTLKIGVDVHVADVAITDVDKHDKK